MKASDKELSIFCKQLATISKSGVNIYDAFEILFEFGVSKKIKGTITGIRAELFKGNSLYFSMSKHNRVYKNFLLSMIKIGENSGNLDEMLLEAYEYYRKKSGLSRELLSVLFYPIILLIAVISLIIFLNEKILPQIIQTIISMGGKLPKITLIIIAINKIVKSNLFIICFFLMLFSCTMTTTMLHKKKIYIYHYFFKISIFKKVKDTNYLLNSIRAMSMLLNSGIGILQGIEMLIEDTKDRYYKDILKGILISIKTGEDVGSSLKENNIINPMLLSMVGVGEKTGKLDEMLRITSDILEDKLTSKLKKGMELIGPIIIMILGLVVSSVILSFVLPMVNLMDSIH